MTTQTTRQMFDQRIAAKYGADRSKILEFYDQLVKKHRGDELEALTEFESILKRFDVNTALQIQLDNLGSEISDFKAKLDSAVASTDCKSLLTPAAREIFNCLDGRKISVQNNPLERVRLAQQRADEINNRAKALESELDDKESKPSEDGTIDFGLLKLTPKIRAGIIERKETYRSLASAKHLKSGLALEVTYIKGR